MNLKRSFFLGCFFAVFLLIHATAFAEMVSIRGDNVNMRSGPGTNHEILWKIGNTSVMDCYSKNTVTTSKTPHLKKFS